MCGIKCIKTLLFAFNFIFWVCVINFKLLFASLSHLPLLKFAAAYNSALSCMDDI